MYDLVLKGGRIYDGSGMPSYNADVAIHERQDRRNRPPKRQRAANAQRRRLGGRARLYRSAHASRRAIALGPARHIVVFPRRYFGGRRQLRLEPGAGQAGRPRRGDQELCARGSDQPPGARRRHRMEVDFHRRISRRARRPPGNQCRRAGRPYRRAPLRHGRRRGGTPGDRRRSRAR